MRHLCVMPGCTGRSVACKTAHTVERRLVRRLLMTRDRPAADEPR